MALLASQMFACRPSRLAATVLVHVIAWLAADIVVSGIQRSRLDALHWREGKPVKQAGDANTILAAERGS